MPLHSTNPATNLHLRSFPSLDAEGLRARIDLAAAYRSAGLEHRVLCLHKLAALLTGECKELAGTITQETGKPIRRAEQEIARCADLCRHYAEHAARLLTPELLQAGSGSTFVQWEPMGVLLAIMPWESPFWQPFRLAIPNLMGGNAVLLKHAASVPQCALSMATLLRRAGFEPGAFTTLLMEDDLVESVLNDERVTSISVIGTRTMGRALAAQAGWLLKESSLRLPGSDPFLVMPSADLDAAAEAVKEAISEGTGSGKRLIVSSTIYNDFVQRLVPALEALSIGDPSKAETQVGPLGTIDAINTLAEQVEAAVAAGGRILTGGARLVGRGNFFEPTLLSDVPRSHAVARDVCTGPLSILFRVGELADALSIANEGPFASTASIWTREPAEQQQLISGIQASFIALNALPVEDASLSTRDGKRSGRGRESVSGGIHEFMHTKTVSIPSA